MSIAASVIAQGLSAGEIAVSPISSAAGGQQDYLASIAAKIGDGDAWTMDELEGNLVGVVNGVEMIDSGSISVSGHVSDARQWASSSTGADATGVALFPTANATVAAWVKLGADLGDPPAASIGADAVLIDHDSGPLIYISARYDGSDYAVYAECTTDTGTTQSTGFHVVAPGVFSHVAVVRTAAGFTLYVNGSAVETVAVASGQAYTSVVGDYLYVAAGILHVPTGRSATTACDEVLVAHDALTAGEIAWLYNGGAGRSVSIFAP